MRAESARPFGRVRGWLRRISGMCGVPLSLGAIGLSSVFVAGTSLASEGTPEWLPPERNAPGVLVFPPADRTSPRPITVMLHGMCGTPENACPYFARVAAKDSWLICPRGTLTCPSGG